MRVDGRGLEYRRIGPAASNAPTLVFLHEGLGSAGGWRDFPDAVCARTACGGLVYSRAGHGRSDPFPGSRTPRYMHHEATVVLPELLRALDIDRPVLVGHSDGGSIALIAAGSGLVQPAALVLEAPHVFVEQITVEAISRLRERFVETDFRARLARQHGANTDLLLADWSAIWLSPEFRSWNIEASLQQIRSPTLVIQGIQDEFATRAQVDAIAGALGPRRCETLLLERCGHSPHADQRELVEHAVARFVASVARPGDR